MLSASTGELTKVYIATARDLASITELRLSSDRRLLLQINSDGRFHFYDLMRRIGTQDLSERGHILSGVYVDDEIVLYTDDGYYDGTPEGATYVRWNFRGHRTQFDFAQFSARFRSPEIIRKILEGKGTSAPGVKVEPPPNIELSVSDLDSDTGEALATIKASSQRPLSSVQLYVDGTPADKIALSGRSDATSHRLLVSGGSHWITAVASNDIGYTSAPASVLINRLGLTKRGRLLSVCVGINEYPLEPDHSLHFAEQDATAMDRMLNVVRKRQYDAIEQVTLIGPRATRESIVRTISDLGTKAGAGDTFIIYISGHGTQGADGNFFFLSYDCSFASAQTRGLAWSSLAASLATSKARILVLLDACRSGAAGAAFVPNDVYARQLVESGAAGMVVLAASKGRQSSLESDAFGGGHGAFNKALIDALSTDFDKVDANGNGLLEIEELASYVRFQVSSLTHGRQTPWLTRAEILGPVWFF
jgi:hypothetical protein